MSFPSGFSSTPMFSSNPKDGYSLAGDSDEGEWGEFPEAKEITSTKGIDPEKRSFTPIKITYPDGFRFCFDVNKQRFGYLSPTTITSQGGSGTSNITNAHQIKEDQK